MQKKWASLHTARYKNQGFTIVELLIVIVVIGILAAIVIVAYNGIQNSAYDTGVKNDLANVAKKLEMFKTRSTDGRYPVGPSELVEADIKLSQSNYQTTNSSGNLRNNVYYIITTAANPAGYAQGYAIGTVSKSGKVLCLVNGTVSEAACGGGDATRLLIGTATDTSWSSTGHSDSSGWQDWTQ